MVFGQSESKLHLACTTLTVKAVTESTWYMYRLLLNSIFFLAICDKILKANPGASDGIYNISTASWMFPVSYFLY